MIGVYERTMTLPGDVHLCAIAKALGKEPKDLLWPLLTTINGHGKDAATTLELTDLGDGRASIRIAAEVSLGGSKKGCRPDHAAENSIAASAAVIPPMAIAQTGPFGRFVPASPCSPRSRRRLAKGRPGRNWRSDGLLRRDNWCTTGLHISVGTRDISVGTRARP